MEYKFKERLEWSYTIFLTGIIGFIVVTCIHLIYDLISGIVFGITLFILPVIIAVVMIDMYDKWALHSFSNGNQSFTNVEVKEN